jgi:hypothetical protein
MKDIIRLLNENGPMTGKELHGRTGMDLLELWKCCAGSREIYSVAVGKRYLRLDRQVEGYARLSPSILREFYNYSVMAAKDRAGASR